MPYVIKAAITNPNAPESGIANIPFPLGRDEYEHTIKDVLEPMGIGDALAQDCKVEEIDSYYGILICLKGKTVNVDELDYLAKRLESFDQYEAEQFQAASHAFGCRNIRSLINMTFCCQETTVIRDLSKLEEAGKRHYLTTHGGAAPADKMDQVDGKALAEELIQSRRGLLTPYGLFFCNQVKTERLKGPYRGMGFPPYLWEPSLAEVELTAKNGITAYAFLPTSELALARFCRRNEIQLSELPSFKLTWLSQKQGPIQFDGGESELLECNEVIRELESLPEERQSAFLAAIEMIGVEEVSQMRLLLNALDDFSFRPGVKNAEDYGRYMVQKSGYCRYDPDLEDYYNYEALGKSLMEHECGQFVRRGYLKCDEGSAFADFFIQDGPEQKRPQGETTMTMEMEEM